MGVTSTSSGKSLRLYNGRGNYNEWTFVPVQRNLNAGGGAQGADAPGMGRGGRGGRGTQQPGPGSSMQPSTGGQGFRPPTGSFGTQQPGGRGR
jgi:hypothetical protein